MLDMCRTCQFSEDMPHGCMGHGGSYHNITDAVIAIEESEEIREPKSCAYNTKHSTPCTGCRFCHVFGDNFKAPNKEPIGGWNPEVEEGNII